MSKAPTDRAKSNLTQLRLIWSRVTQDWTNSGLELLDKWNKRGASKKQADPLNVW